MMVSNMADYLLRQTVDGEFGPGLAQSYSQPNRLTWVYNIRPGVKFWDGNPLTAADVVYSLKRNLDPKAQPVNSNVFANVQDIKATGPLQVTVTFKKPDELFNKEMSSVGGAVTEKAYAENKGKLFGTAAGGVMYTGPYMLKKWSPGSEIVLEKNPNYWDPAYTPKVQTVTVKFIVDQSTLTNALLSGQIDGAYEVPAPAIPALQTASNGKLYAGPSLKTLVLNPTNEPGPMTNVRLRMALGMAIDKTAIVNTIYNGAAIAEKTITPETAWDPGALDIYKTAYEALPSLTPDVAAAKQIVSGESGTSKPIVYAVLAGDQTELQVASVVQQAASSIGLTVKLKQMTPLDFSNAYYVPSYRKGINIMPSVLYLYVVDPLDMLTYFWGPGAMLNFLDYQNPTVVNNVAKARSTFDPTTRAQLITEAQAQYTKDQNVIPIASTDVLLFMNNRITGGPVTFAYLYLPFLATIGAK